MKIVTISLLLATVHSVLCFTASKPNIFNASKTSNLKVVSDISELHNETGKPGIPSANDDGVPNSATFGTPTASLTDEGTRFPTKVTSVVENSNSRSSLPSNDNSVIGEPYLPNGPDSDRSAHGDNSGNKLTSPLQDPHVHHPSEPTPFLSATFLETTKNHKSKPSLSEDYSLQYFDNSGQVTNQLGPRQTSLSSDDIIEKFEEIPSADIQDISNPHSVQISSKVIYRKRRTTKERKKVRGNKERKQEMEEPTEVDQPAFWDKNEEHVQTPSPKKKQRRKNKGKNGRGQRRKKPGKEGEGSKDDLEKELTDIAGPKKKLSKGDAMLNYPLRQNVISPKRIQQHIEHKKKVREWLQRRVQEQINQRRIKRNPIM